MHSNLNVAFSPTNLKYYFIRKTLEESFFKKSYKIERMTTGILRFYDRELLFGLITRSVDLRLSQSAGKIQPQSTGRPNHKF